MARAIILGYDGSECAEAALEAAVDIAHDSPCGSTGSSVAASCIADRG